MADKTPNNIDRRRFFGRMLAMTTAASAMVLLKPSGTQGKEARAGQTAGYRETDHVRRYYRSARG